MSTKIPQSRFKKMKTLWILVVLIVLFSAWRAKLMYIPPKIWTSSFHRLEYVFLRQAIDTEGLFFNLNPKEADFGPHEAVLINVVGTLVKLSESGQFEPYLSESFSTSNDGLVWSFNIRPGLYCEDGYEITAKTFSEVITQSLKRYSQYSKVIDFELLKGWNDFISGKSESLSGITYQDNKLIFHLEAQPENFIGHLRLPYFGFWCPNNFNKNGEFKDNSRIISSGAYSVIDSSKNSMLLKKRENWFSISSDSPEEIYFRYSIPDQLSSMSKWSIVEILGRDKVANLPSFQEIKSPPSLMWNLVLSPLKQGPFLDIKNRQAFSDRIIELKKTSSLFNSFFFYPSKPSEVKMRGQLTPYTPEMKGKKIKFAFANKNYTPEEIDEIKRLTTEALKDSGAEVEFFMNDPLKDNWRHRLFSHKEFDIRTNGVNQGGYPKNRTVKMMFCSNLGVCYPDPSGRICKIVEYQDKIGGPIPQEYIEEFNQALYDDAVVLPLTHFGTHWLVSEGIDLKTLPPSSGVFHFEGIRLK